VHSLNIYRRLNSASRSHLPLSYCCEFKSQSPHCRMQPWASCWHTCLCHQSV